MVSPPTVSVAAIAATAARTPAGHRDPVAGDQERHQVGQRHFQPGDAGGPAGQQSDLRVTSRRCQANGVAGVTAKTSLHRCRGISLDSAASHSRSPGW